MTFYEFLNEIRALDREWVLLNSGKIRIERGTNVYPPYICPIFAVDRSLPTSIGSLRAAAQRLQLDDILESYIISGADRSTDYNQHYRRGLMRACNLT